MAISDKLNYLIETKQLFKDRLNSLGSEITSSTSFRNYLTWLDTFYGEVSDKTDISVNGVVGRTSQESTTGKNFAIFEQPNTTISGLTINYNNVTGKISIKGKATTTSGVRVSNQMQTNIPSGTYTLSINSALPVLINYVVADSQNNNTAFRMTAGNTSVTNTLSNNGVQASLFVAIENNVEYDLEFYMQLEKGSTATSYEPYTNGASPNPDYPQPINNLTGNVAYKITTQNGEQTFDIPLGDIELCEIDTYEDKIYSSDGKFYLNKNIGKVVLNGSESWSGYINSKRLIYFYTGIDRLQVNEVICNKLVKTNNMWTQATYENLISGSTNGRALNIMLEDEEINTVNKLLAWLPNNNLLVYYPLATPTTTEITQENYPALYNALKQIQDYLTSYKINKEFVLGYSSPEIEY